MFHANYSNANHLYTNSHAFSYFHPASYTYNRLQKNPQLILNAYKENYYEKTYVELSNAGMNGQLIDYLVYTTIVFTLQTAPLLEGTQLEKTDRVYEQLHLHIPWMMPLTLAYQLSQNQVKKIFRGVIRFTITYQ
jgi:hypothetical protein